jgi:ABC-2 type transport system permease protein
MNAGAAATRQRFALGLAEARKLQAFVRRDVLVMISYRVAFVSDLVFIVAQAVLFYFVARIVDATQLPTYGGTTTTYMEFVMIGVVVSTVSGLLLQRVATAIRDEQMMGTLEALLTSPTSPATIQVGSIAVDLLFIPVRMGVLLVAVALVFGLDLQPSGVVPALVVFAAFVPFVWGLGLTGAGATLTFRRGSGLVAAGVSLLALASGAFFPLDLLPGWLQTLAEINPLAIAIEAIREVLIGGAGWNAVRSDVLLLMPLSTIAIVFGVVAFRLALAREHRRGTLGLY